MDTYNIKAIKTSAFQADIDSIDAFLDGKIIQKTWQTNPVLKDGEQYIIYKPILDDWLDGREVIEIEISISEDLF